jgi:K+-sensing histidine kinase KdpD
MGVLISTIWRGFLAGFFSMVLGLISAWYITLPPEFGFDTHFGTIVSLIVYIVTSLVVFGTAYRLQVAEGRAKPAWHQIVASDDGDLSAKGRDTDREITAGNAQRAPDLEKE